ncbi:MAG: DUF465 domain-containing protein [Rickettsiales bacterium]|nr:DUF465 domain-containing protein [Rickettsiales bacterium]
MAFGNRISSLKNKHEFIEHSIQHEMSRIKPDTILIHDLKVRKLRIKEELMKLGIK